VASRGPGLMNVAVLGLWHLGSVTAACVAEAGHVVIAFDPSAATVADLQAGRPPVAEPGLEELVQKNLAAGRLRFTDDVSQAVSTASVVWICFDTPVDDDDRADVDQVIDHVVASFPFLPDGAVVLVSSQLPVGSARRLEAAWSPIAGGRRVSFACSPENLRLGKAIAAFTQPDRVVIGVRDDAAREKLGALFAPIAANVEWMSVESAEMTKHAINAFLATSVTFINELANLCEVSGADAKQVERGLKTESRIGPRAYLAPGGAVAGGTLARDVMFLRSIGGATERPTPLLDGVVASNVSHRSWARRRLVADLGQIKGRTIAVWGLTYKPGTDTLRRSESVELCRWLIAQGARVRAHDPAVRSTDAVLPGVERTDDPVSAAREAAALVVATEWPEYRRIDANTLATATTGDLLVLDANRFLATTLGADSRFRFVSVGQPRV
jgi:UDPglucose 6-dehydrogenase